MSIFSFEALSIEYNERVDVLRGLCAGEQWPRNRTWLAPTDLLLTHHTNEVLGKKLRPYICQLGFSDVKTIKLLEFARVCGRVKDDFPSRISEYSHLTALYYLWSELNKTTQPDEAQRALWGGICVLMKLIGVLEALEIAHIQEKQEKKKMTAREKGGQAQNERYDSVKQEIAKLLKSKTVGEYATKQAAAEAILEAVWLFSESLTAEINAENQKLPTYQQTRKAPGLVKDNLIRQMLDWSRKDDKVSDAFNHVVQPRKGGCSGRSQVEHGDGK
ncbi:hypothetical protein [Aeromonas sobria]|uniref:hypothetical protein n=1 Tax=Aeromonas sobria TaxID=646 RepID=UPI001EFF999E|nr:hypothetical protein [Aeromonas sobria]GKQ74553.1 hypothetical protein KAM447_10610 [Aeromonas caviae]